MTSRQYPLPGRRAHELFAEQARDRPDAVAVAHRGTRWTYDELNRRANRIAHRLLDRGLAAEDVVAVESGRTLSWAAAVLGVFKAGGVYLPIDPAYPSDRVQLQLRRSAARFVLTGTGQPDPARYPAAATVSPLQPPPGPESHDEDPAVQVGERQLAYIYFTSGSTGLPKGAMCEHLGMLNHLLAKIEVLGLGPDDVVVQSAPVAFDISLWQLVAVLLTGGRVELVSGDDLLDAGRFLDTVLGAGATVLQLVPSYLDVLLGDLEARPRGPGRLRWVSVTGEAISSQLVTRWLARFPGIPLVNAYGATEASDDTTHAVLTEPPRTPLVPVGRPIRNVTVYVVDDQLAQVPPGSVGEIVFSGICVGRGYINDPERTREAFSADPYRPGERLYRTGDYGRWLPDGDLEFLGRRDDQVKIRGMRVETGELEHRVLAAAGVHTAAVVVREGAGGKSLVAFYTGEPEMTEELLLTELRAALPAHLVPAACHRLSALPLTANGKTDRRTLKAMADRLAVTSGGTPPAAGTERRLATAWAEVLGRTPDEVAADDDFFDLGGDSLAAVRLVVKLDRAVSLTDLTRHPVLRELAKVIDGDRHGGENPILQRLNDVPDTATLVVCVPDGGGNALDFQRLAQALAPAGVQVRAVEPPGHDLGDQSEPLAGVATVAGRVARELATIENPAVLLWGHGAGSSIAVETARLCAHAGRPVRRLFLAARPLAAPSEAEHRLAAVEAMTDDDVLATLAAQTSFTDLDELQPERAGLVGGAYRHDTGTDLRYLAAALADPVRHQITTAVTVVTAADDPAVVDGEQELLRWQRLAGDVTYETLARGGRQFHRTEPDLVAEVLLRYAPVPSTADTGRAG
jgi:amino acid adenylation domain-containing protein